MKDTIQRKYQNLLVLLQSFEGYWNYFSVSEGEFYKEVCKDEAKKLVGYFLEVYKVDKEIYNSKSITYNSADSDEFVRGILKGLKKWATNKEIFPLFYNEHGNIENAKSMLSQFCMCEKLFLCKKLKLNIFPIINWDPQQEYFKDHIRWSGHLPPEAIDLVSADFAEKLSNADTIVLVADIRKSQDLMTYGPDADFFRDRILEFMNQMREIINDHYGIFDKFTGDGFLCYFNSRLCKHFKKDYYDQMLKACKEIMSFSNIFFEDWIKHVRKLPPNSSGLTLGIDSGIVKFRNLNNHLFVIGDSIVWANRMSSAGKKGEIILNNIPFFKIRDIAQDVHFEAFENVTKGGESFTAYKMTIK